MSESKWAAGQVAFQDRMPPLPAGSMTVTTVSMVMNVAHSPPPEDKSVGALLPYPL